MEAIFLWNTSQREEMMPRNPFLGTWGPQGAGERMALLGVHILLSGGS
jgi:hypothetical protein